MIRRIYVEKKKGFDTESAHLYADIMQDLNPQGLEGIRILNRYDVEDIDDDTYEKAKVSVFSEPAVDAIYDEDMPQTDSADRIVAVEYLPGQFDQRADSAEQCIRLIEPEAQPIVKFAKIIILQGNISDADLDRIEGYCINPVDSQAASMEKPETLKMEMTEPEDVRIVEGFREMSDEETFRYREEMGFAMSEGDIVFVRDHFRDDEHRDPTVTELRVIDTYWSDHCRHTTFNTELTDIRFSRDAYGKIVEDAFKRYLDIRKEVYGEKEPERKLTLMDMAVIGAKYVKSKGMADDIDESEEINACSIKVTATINDHDEDWLVMFKNETHNHPTEIEPFGGAATCLGGAIRDPLSGRVYVYQAMRVTGAADPRTPVEDTIEGKLPQRKITKEAAQGYSSYGNQIGLATGLVDEVYHDNYVAKRMEVGAVVGAAPADYVIRKRPQPGDIVILVGGRTGRDGCGGATGSSKEHTVDSILECGAEVQKGNPPTERNIQRLFTRKEVANMIKRCNDFGAGGVSVAIGELADGLDIDLDKVPKKYEGLDGTELAISESQERMAVVVDPEDEEVFKAYAAAENLEATTVAVVTEEPRVKMKWRGKNILDLSRAFLDTNGARQVAEVSVTMPEGYVRDPQYLTIEDSISDLNCCSKKGLIERFDSTIGASTVLMPLGGKYQLSPQAGMASKLPLRDYDGKMQTSTVMAYGYDPRIATNSPFHGAMFAVVDSVTKIVAMGGDRKKVRLSFQEYFGKTSSPENWGKPFSALLGSIIAQQELMIPAIGGKDSMSGTFMDIDVPPALISFAIAPMPTDKVISSELKGEESGDVDTRLVLVKQTYNADGTLDFEKYRRSMDAVHKLMDEGMVLSALNVGRGGAFMTAVKMAAGNKKGLLLYGLPELEWTEERYGEMVLEFHDQAHIKDHLDSYEGFDSSDLDYQVIGFVKNDDRVVVRGERSEIFFESTIDKVLEKWQAPLEGIFPTRVDKKKDETEVPKPLFDERGKNKSPFRAQLIGRKPKVIIPVFPGTNCEDDSSRAFSRAGADVDVFIMKNLTAASLNESIETLAKKIKDSQIIMIPGGFSGGDEPDGSAKFIASVFRNPLIAEATMDLIDNRAGLMLGICNGFQALVKLGLLPYGKIVEPSSGSPTLTYNTIGRHVSRYVNTRIASVKSPWFAGVEAGDVFAVPVSHGEGRFMADESTLKELAANGQIATQYVDFNGDPSMDIDFNPNGSLYAIEGITSADGRILGKMGHSERKGDFICENVPGNKRMKIFRSGVEYFK